MRASYIVLVLTFLIIFSCSEDDSISERGFLRILDDRDLGVAYSPISIINTLDTGYMVLAEKQVTIGELPLAVILTINDDGNFTSTDSVDISIRKPIGDLMQVGDSYYFFAMQESDYQGFLVTVDGSGTITTTTALGSNFPVASSKVNDQFLLLSYDAQNTNMDLQLVNTDGSIGGSGSYTIGAGSDIQQRLLDHFFEDDQKLPFFTGVSTSGNYYFNGIYNFTFSLVFTDLSATPTGVVQGQGDVGGISAYHPIAGGAGALVGFQYEDNFYQTNAAVSETGISSSINFFVNDVPELAIKAKSEITSITSGGNDYLVIASETESRQVVVYFFEQTSGELKAIEYLGYINPYSFGDLFRTADDELLITGSFFANGRFERPYIKKFTTSEIQQIVSR